MFISEVYNVTWTVPEEEANGEPHVEQKFQRQGGPTQRGSGGQEGTIDRGFEDIGATGGASEGEKQAAKGSEG